MRGVAMDGTGLLVVGLVMLVGLLGILLPVVPGLLLIWGAALVWAWQENTTGPWVVFGVLTVLAVVGTVAKYLLGGRAVTASGAPRSTLAIGAVGGIAGFFIIPVLGLLIGAVLGVLIAERLRLGEWGPAGRATWALIVGVGIGMLVELIAGVVMTIVWFAAAVVPRWV